MVRGKGRERGKGMVNLTGALEDSNSVQYNTHSIVYASP